MLGAAVEFQLEVHLRGTQIADQTLFPQAASWIFGANIPGKKRTVMFYLGGIKQYRSLAAAESSAGYPGFISNADILTPA